MKCPKCGENTSGDRWTACRKLQRYCHECGWKGKPRTPENRPVKITKKVPVDQFIGWQFEVFDKYGHVMVMSCTYHTRVAALAELRRDLERGKTDKEAGPYTGVLWPPTVEVTGEKFT